MADTGKRLESRGGDLVIHVESTQRCFSSGQLTMPGAGGPFSIENPAAYPLLAGNIPAKQGEEASVVAFVVQGKGFSDIAASGTTKVSEPYTILNDFTGAVLNQDAFPPDYDGNAFDGAAIAAAVTGAKWVSEADKQSVQTN